MPSPIRKLAIVGASVRAAAFSAIRAGYDVAAADLFADADLARVCLARRIEQYPGGLVDWLAECDCDAWLYTGALENHPGLIDHLAGLCPLLGNSGDALRNVRDPLQLQTALTESRIAFPETRASAAALPHDGSWLCKTYRGASGTGVWRLDCDAARYRAERERAVFQRFIEGETLAVIFAMGAGRVQFWGATRQIVGRDAAKPWQYVGSIGPVNLGMNLNRQINALGEVLAKRFALRGLVGVDLIVADDRAWVVEVNPRYTASIEVLERATGKSAIGTHVAACRAVDLAVESVRADQCATARKRRVVHGKAIVFASQTVRILLNFAQWTVEQAARDSQWPWLADLPREGDLIAAGRPMLTVFASAETAEDCELQLRDRMSVVESRAYGYES